MNGFKSQLKEFWAYYRLTAYGTAVSNDKASAKNDSIFLVAMFMPLFFICQMCSGSYFIIDYLFVAFVGVGVSLGLSTRNKTSLVNVAPFTPTQRIIFSVLVTILRSLIAVLIVTAIGAVFISVIALIAYLVAGENIFIYASEDLTAYSAYGQSLQSLLSLTAVFAMFAISHINKVKVRNIVAASFIVLSSVAVIITNTVLGNIVNPYDSWYNIHVFGEMFVWIDSTAHPWILVVIAAVLAAASFAAAIYLLIKRHKSSKL